MDQQLGWGPVPVPRPYPLSDLSAVQRPVPQPSLRNGAAKDAVSSLGSTTPEPHSPQRHHSSSSLPTITKRFVTPARHDMERGMDWSATDNWISSLRSSPNTRPASPDRPESREHASPQSRPQTRSRSPAPAKPSPKQRRPSVHDNDDDDASSVGSPVSHRSISGPSLSGEPLPPIGQTTVSEPAAGGDEAAPVDDDAAADPGHAAEETAPADEAVPAEADAGPEPEPASMAVDPPAVHEPAPGLHPGAVGIVDSKATPFDDIAFFRDQGKTVTRLNSIMIRAGGVIEEINSDYAFADGSNELVQIGHEGRNQAELLNVAVYEHIYKVTGKVDKKRGLCALQFHLLQDDLDKRKSAYFGSQFGESFSLTAPEGQCVLGFYGTVNREVGIMSLGVHYGPITHAMQS
eukprot:TRINITY_DN7747_c0_g1_i1.p2 TRINITY_DN7747_c0_g1~~TRINITY_DN7747_c0_g1_i1.p2  ORF type:complete len:405 (-),score=150.49 TRINITY_DN7747_c0_g1_i1:305-1519(-)